MIQPIHAANVQSMINQTIQNEKKTNAIDIADDFKKLLHNQIDKLNTDQHNVNHLTSKFIQGEGVEPHEVMIASQKAMLGIELTVQVRNKAVEAYQEIMRMQV